MFGGPKKAEDVDAYFHEVDISQQEQRARDMSAERGFFAYYASLGLVRKPLARRYREERTRLVALSMTPFEEKERRHVELLEEISRLYTGKGGSYEKIDEKRMRSMGVKVGDSTRAFPNGGWLSLWMMLYVYKQNPGLTMKIFGESKEWGSEYPFGEICDDITGWVLEAIKKGKLNAIVEDIKTENREEDGETDDCPFIQAAQQLFVGFLYK